MNAVINRTETLEANLAKAIAKTWLEPEFAQKLSQHPTAALAEMGVSVGSNVHIEVSQGTEAKWSLQQSGGRTIYSLTLVPCPTELNGSSAQEDLGQLETVALGCTTCTTCGTTC